MFPTTPCTPPLRTRRPLAGQAACTHMIMTRFYIASPMSYLSGECRMCHRRPNIGWVYRCTEEDGGFLPASDFAIPEEHLIAARTRDDDSINHLSPAVVRAIKEDQYTEEQIKILIEQKRGVRN